MKVNGVIHSIDEDQENSLKQDQNLNEKQFEVNEQVTIEPNQSTAEQTHELMPNIKQQSEKDQRYKQQNRHSSRIDLILQMLGLVLLIVAVMSQIHLRYLINNQTQVKIAEINKKQKWTTVYTSSFFKNINKQLNANDNNQKYEHINQYQVEKLTRELKSLNCQKYKVLLLSYKQQHIKIKKPQQKLPLIDKERVQQERQEEADRLEVQRVNKQQLRHKPPQFKQMAGITYQKLQNAKLFKTLVEIDPWQDTVLSKQQYDYFQRNYHISSYPKQLPFCIVVPTFNNEQNKRYKRNIDSIVHQNYTNYHVVIINDASTDATGQLIQQRINQLKTGWAQRGKVINISLISNEKQMRAMPNLRMAATQFCQPDEIFLVVDGDDQIVGRQVLKLFNARFQETDSWFVYSNFMSFVGNTGFSRPLKQQVKQNNSYRQSNFVTSHLRAFYTQLFRFVKEQDLKDETGEYFKAANDVAICIPILEMCHRRVSYIAQITYMYNSNTGLNNHMIRLNEQIQNSKYIRSKKKYDPLPELKFS